jgi:hypothetical protein
VVHAAHAAHAAHLDRRACVQRADGNVAVMRARVSFPVGLGGLGLGLRLGLPLGLAALAGLLGACAGGIGQGGTGSAQCSDSQRTCLTAPSCTWDKDRACELCRCSPPDAPPDYTPQGPPRME